MVTTGTVRVDDCRRRTAPSVSKHLLAVLINFELKLAFCVFVGRDNSRGWESDSRGWWIRHGGSCEMKRRFRILDTALGRSDSLGWDDNSRGWWIRHGGSCQLGWRFGIPYTALGRSGSRGWDRDRSWDSDSRGW
jgi:hypothetical protein